MLFIRIGNFLSWAFFSPQRWGEMVNNTLMSFEKYLTYDARPKVVEKGSLVTTVSLSPGLLDNSVTDFYAYSCRYLFIYKKI